MRSIVAERGQVTIPKPLRDRLGIRPRTVLDFREDKGRIVVVKVTPEDPVTKVTGCLRLGRTTDELIRELRGEP